MDGSAEGWRRRYEMLTKFSPDALIIHVGGSIVYANQAAAFLTGLDTTEELIGRNIQEFVHSQSLAGMYQRLSTLEHVGDATAPSEALITKVNGGLALVETLGVLVTWDGQRAVQTIVRNVGWNRKSSTSISGAVRLIEMEQEIARLNARVKELENKNEEHT